MSNHDWTIISLYLLSVWGWFYYKHITGETAYLKIAWGSLVIGLFLQFAV